MQQHALTRFRLSSGLSRKEVAKRAGTTRQTIHRIEAGNQQPSWKLASKLIEVAEGELTTDDFMPKSEAAE